MFQPTLLTFFQCFSRLVQSFFLKVLHNRGQYFVLHLFFPLRSVVFVLSLQLVPKRSLERTWVAVLGYLRLRRRQALVFSYSQPLQSLRFLTLSFTHCIFRIPLFHVVDMSPVRAARKSKGESIPYVPIKAREFYDKDASPNTFLLELLMGVYHLYF